MDAEDPFKNSERSHTNYASMDTGADEQFDHAKISAVRTQVDRKIIQTKKALARVKIGEYAICEECGEFIDTDRLLIYPEATLCVKCEAKKLHKNE